MKTYTEEQLIEYGKACYTLGGNDENKYHISHLPELPEPLIGSVPSSPSPLTDEEIETEAMLNLSSLYKERGYSPETYDVAFSDDSIKKHLKFMAKWARDEMLKRSSPVKPSESKIDSKDIAELISVLNHGINKITQNQDRDCEASWIDRIGVLLNAKEAKLILTLIERGFIPTSEDKKEPSERNDNKNNGNYILNDTK